MDQRHQLLLKFYLLEEANMTAYCLEKRFTPHDLCDENFEQRVETGA
jgi:hypothetical protein